jgi:hypothetical protein
MAIRILRVKIAGQEALRLFLGGTGKRGQQEPFHATASWFSGFCVPLYSNSVTGDEYDEAVPD